MPSDSDEPFSKPFKPPYQIEPLSSEHDRTAFACGKEALDRFCREQALSWQKRNLATAYVLVSKVQPGIVVGFYTLSMTGIRAEDLPPDLARKFPRSIEIGAVLLGRLAIDASLQGFGLGRVLLLDALERAINMRTEIASYAMAVDAIDGEAKNFYERFGFQPFPETPMRLFLPFKVHLARTSSTTT